MSAYNQGFKEYINGGCSANNPYPVSSGGWKDWKCGYEQVMIESVESDGY